MTDWRSWHDAYDEPGSSLSRRLHVVRRRLHEVLDLGASPAPRLLALCAGDARDVVPVLADRADGRAVHALLVELDDALARRAASAAESAGLRNVVVRCADAGDTTSFSDVVPVDVLLLCGIFGNVEPATVADIVRTVPAMVRASGHVIWTRGRSGPLDHRAGVRRAFTDAGMPERSFDGEPEAYGVGVNQVIDHRSDLPVGRLFAFRATGSSPCRGSR